MRKDEPRNMAASVKDRLLQISRTQREDFQNLLTRYAVERLLYRLGRSEHRTRFILKGASVFAVWQGAVHRPTKDVDFLGFGSDDVQNMKEAIRLVCRQEVDDDGLFFDAASVSGAPIRENVTYGGVRINLLAMLGKARIPLQVDVGFGDAVTPQPQEETVPTLLEMPKPLVLVYPRETVVAEKCEAMISLGMANTRLKDFYDLWHLATHFDFDGPLVCQAVQATLERRGTLLGDLPPAALSDSFYNDQSRKAQWRAFLKRIRNLSQDIPTLPGCIKLLETYLLPILQTIKSQALLEATWRHEILSWK